MFKKESDNIHCIPWGVVEKQIPKELFNQLGNYNKEKDYVIIDIDKGIPRISIDPTKFQFLMVGFQDLKQRGFRYFMAYNDETAQA